MKRAALTLAAVGLLVQAADGQTTIHVPDDQPTIQAGIDAAANGDTVLVAPGVYPEHDVQFRGLEITVRSAGGPRVTTVDAQGLGRVFHFNNGETPASILEGFALANGNAENGITVPIELGRPGGGVYIAQCSPTIRDCILLNNHALREGGGGMYIGRNTSPLVEGCVFVGNDAGDGYDAGLAGTGGDGGSGGGIYIDEDSQARIVSCVLIGNRAGDGGRGGDRDPIGYPAGEGGWGGVGAGIFSFDAHSTIVNTIVADNACGLGGPGGIPNGSRGADGYAGGIYARDQVEIANCVIVFNQGGGDFVGGGLVARQGTLKNSIVGGNVPDQITGEYGFPSLTVSYCCVQGGFAGVGNIDADPLFLDPAHHNYRLLPGSPCIDAGDNTGVPAWLDLDRRGWPRFLDDPFTVDTGVPGGLHPVVDMGAYEYGWRLRRTGDRRPPIAPPRRFD